MQSILFLTSAQVAVALELVSSGGLTLVIIAAILGFLLGSIPARSEMTGQDFDSQGALIWAFSAAVTAYGIAVMYQSGNYSPGTYFVGLGWLTAAARVYYTRPAPKPTGHPLKDGLNYATGDTPKAKRKSAERSFELASFLNGSGRPAARGREWYFASTGIPAHMLTTVIGPSMKTASSDMFAILVLLVSELPDEPHGPGLVVINGTSNLRAATVDETGITPVGSSKIAAGTILAAVGYAWR